MRPRATIVVGVVFGRVAFGEPVADAELAIATGVLTAYGASRIVETR